MADALGHDEVTHQMERSDLRGSTGEENPQHQGRRLFLKGALLSAVGGALSAATARKEYVKPVVEAIAPPAYGQALTPEFGMSIQVAGNTVPQGGTLPAVTVTINTVPPAGTRLLLRVISGAATVAQGQAVTNASGVAIFTGITIPPSIPVGSMLTLIVTFADATVAGIATGPFSASIAIQVAAPGVELHVFTDATELVPGSTGIVTVSVKQGGSPVPGVVVALSSTPTGDADHMVTFEDTTGTFVPTITALTNNGGLAMATFMMGGLVNVGDSFIIIAAAFGGTGTTVVTAVATAPGVALAVTPNPASGPPGTSGVVTVAYTRNGEPRSGVEIDLSVSGTGLSLGTESVVTGPDGTATTSYAIASDATAGTTFFIIATGGGASTTATLTVTLGAVTVSITTPASGDDYGPGATDVVTVNVSSGGTGVAGQTVTLASSSGDLTFTSGTLTTDAGGNASTTFTISGAATIGVSITITATSAGVSAAIFVDIVAAAVVVSITTPGAGTDYKPGDSATVTANVKWDGTNAPGQTVTFTSSSPDITFTTNTVLTDGSGNASTTFLVSGSATTGVSRTITATSLSSSGSVIVDIVAVIIGVTITTPANGTDYDRGNSATVTANVTADGSPADGRTVTFTSSSPEITFTTNTVVTSGGGNASTTFVVSGSATTGVARTITATSSGVIASVSINIGRIDTLTVAAVPNNPASPAVGTVTANVTRGGNPVPGATVTFTVTPPAGALSLSSGTAISDGTGNAIITYSVSAAGTFIIQASAQGFSDTDTVTAT